MVSIFNWKQKYPDLEWMAVDMHSHILPSIDDGCETLMQSVGILKRLENLGLKKFFFTPHIMRDLYPNTVEIIAQKYAELEKEDEISHLMGGFAAEYMVDSSLEYIIQNEPKNLLELPGGYVLLELSYMDECKTIEKVIFNLQMQGKNPILAHPERYLFYHKEPRKLQRFKEIGCLLQVNLLSSIGYYGKNECTVANYLAGKGWIDLIGTDLHHERHFKAIEIGLQRRNMQSQFKKCKILNEELFNKVPSSIA